MYEVIYHGPWTDIHGRDLFSFEVMIQGDFFPAYQFSLDKFGKHWYVNKNFHMAQHSDPEFCQEVLAKAKEILESKT